MNQADKATLRLAIGLGLATLVAYGLAISQPFMVCLMAIAVLSGSGPPLPLVKGAVVAGVIGLVLAAGVLMVPILEHYALAGVLLTTALLYALFFTRARVANPLTTNPLSPLTTIGVVAITLIPALGVAEQALAFGVINALVVGLFMGVLVNIASHALFPDPPGESGAKPAPGVLDPQTARWLALRATVVVMPMYLLALTNPSFYVATVMKTVTLAQQASTLSARSAGKILMGSTLAGAAMALAVWVGLSMHPNLWMLTLWLTAVGLWAGARLFGLRSTAWPPAFWRDALITMMILLGPAIEDSANGSDPYRASAIRVSLFVGVTLYAWAAMSVLERWRDAAAVRNAARSALP
jgi:hypothetical protein